MQIICSPKQNKCFSTILGSFCKIEIWRKFDRRGPYKNSEIFVLSSKVLRKYFFANYLFPSSKEVFLHNFRQFLENWIFDGNSTGADLTKIVKILCYLKLCQKNIFWQIICSPLQKKYFSTILGSFWKIEFLTEIRQARTLQK